MDRAQTHFLLCQVDGVKRPKEGTKTNRAERIGYIYFNFVNLKSVNCTDETSEKYPLS